jgi:hypothetical protein
MSPRCQNCDSFVTPSYARVFTPDGVDNPRCCPNCEDKIRDGADIREARSTRDTGTDASYNDSGPLADSQQEEA